MSIFSRVANTFSSSKLTQDVEAELKAHIEMRIADNLAAGMTPEEARRDARLRFGNPRVMGERTAAVDTSMLLESMVRDARYAARQLRKSPAFMITAALTLMLGIGANVVVFGVLNAAILRPLEVPDADRLHMILHHPYGYDSQSYPDFLDWKERNSTFSAMAAYRIRPMGLSIGSAAYKCWVEQVSTNYFDVLGATPAFGRFFHASDEHGANSAPYIVLSDGFWRSHFAANPGIVGATVDLNEHPFTVIGVAPRWFHGIDLFIWPDFWMPAIDEQLVGEDTLQHRFSHNLWVFGKLNSDVTPQQATEDLNSIARELAKENPATDDDLSARLVKPGFFGDTVAAARPFLLAVMVLAALVLLAACTNLASLFAARTADRSRELAIRLAIGSSRWRLLRQMLSEAILISLIGGAAGTVCAAVLLGSLSQWQPFGEFPIHVTVMADARVYIVALALAVCSGLVFGLLPMRQVWSSDSAQVMKGNADSRIRFRRFAFRDLLLGVQIVLCSLLVTASLVALRGMQHSLNAPLGFNPEGVVLAETDLHMTGHSAEAAARIQKRMLGEVAHIPGVTAVGIIDNTPLGTGGSSTAVFREGTTDFRASNSPFVSKFFSVSPSYFVAAGTRLLGGRAFTEQDDVHAPRVAIVNQTFVHKLLGAAIPIGRRFLLPDKQQYEIVGVVEDGKYDSLAEAPGAALFFPLTQAPTSDTTLVVRAALPSVEVVPPLIRTLGNIDPKLPFTIESWHDALAFVLFPARVATAVLGAMGVLAAMLAVTGIFGMAMYSVSKRLRELGIRVALGAQRFQLMRSALEKPVVLLLGGTAIGMLCGVAASTLLAQIVYDATPRDPMVLGGVVGGMTFLGAFATWIPTRRALRIDPSRLLREQ
jgi:predicted permease